MAVLAEAVAVACADGDVVEAAGSEAAGEDVVATGVRRDVRGAASPRGRAGEENDQTGREAEGGGMTTWAWIWAWGWTGLRWMGWTSMG